MLFGTTDEIIIEGKINWDQFLLGHKMKFLPSDDFFVRIRGEIIPFPHNLN